MTRITTFAAFVFLVSFYSALAEENNGTGPVRQGSPQPQSQTDRPPPKAVEQKPSSAVQQVRPRAVYREISRRISVAGGVLALPNVVYYGVPVILDVPGLGFVDVPEDEYARIYEKLSSSDSEQVEEAMSWLRRIKALEEAEVELMSAGRKEPGRATSRI